MNKLKYMVFAALAAMVSFNLRAEVVEIGSAADFAEKIAANPAGDYMLTADIDCSSWTSLDFSGTLDGDGKTISGLTVPLFGTVSGSAQIKNLVVSGATISHTSGNNYTSGFVASVVDGSDVLVSDIAFTGCTLREAGAASRAGMLAGTFTCTSSGRIQNVSLDATCLLDASAGCGGLGGVCGSVAANGVGAVVTLSNCVNRASVTISSYTTYLAGLVASASCNSTGTAAADLAHIVLEDCANYSSLSINKTNPNFSPLVNNFSNSGGKNFGDITFIRCVNYGDVTINANNQLGGILGSTGNGSPVHMYDCVNYGNLNCTAANKPTGGLVGSLGYILNTEDLFVGCANCGNLTGQIVGGLAGQAAANASYKSSFWRFVSCLQKGVLTASGGDMIAAEMIAKFTQASFPYQVEFAGLLTQSEDLYGFIAADASLKDPIIEGNMLAPGSEGLVDGSDVATLNAFRDCNLWKQGSTGPILKCMPDEPAPDTIAVQFKDAEEFGSVVLKTCIILRGGTPVAPDLPEHEGATFIGWDPEDFSDLQADTDIVAVYQQGMIEHTVRFFDWDGSQIGEDQQVEHNKSAIPPAAPTREGYKFVGWDTDFSIVVEDLNVTAEYVPLVQEVTTGERLAEVLANAEHPEVTYRLKDDVELSAEWKSVDFVSTLDGEGHVIRYTGKKPIFSKLTGGVCNLVLDGETEEGEKTNITGIGERFGLIAATCSGGSIENVTIRNYTLEVANSASALSVAFFCGVAGEGAWVEGCTAESNCLLKTRSSTAAGIVASSLMSDLWVAEDPRLLTILSCTNDADIVTWNSGGGTIAGILADASSGDMVRKPDIVISNCVNNGSFYSIFKDGIQGLFGGIVANRNMVGLSSGVSGGTLTIADCANYGDIDAMGNGLNSQKSIGNYYGGIIAYVYRLGVLIERCQNHGRIGSLKYGEEGEIVDGSSGGIAATLNDNYAANPITVVDSANYGPVYGGRYAGGIFGNLSCNADYRGVFATTTNSANYGALEVVLQDEGLTGEWIGYLGPNPKAPETDIFGAWNCFFMATNIVGQSAGYEAQIVNCQTAQDDGYSVGKARKALTAWAEANGYEPWTQGKVGGKVYPELGIFCEKPYVAGFMMYVR